MSLAKDGILDAYNSQENMSFNQEKNYVRRREQNQNLILNSENSKKLVQLRHLRLREV